MTGEFAVGQADRLNRASRTGLRPSLMFSVAAALVVLVFVFAVGTAPVARAETGPTVRVRVLANQPEVIISNAKGRSIRVVAGASELVVAGVPRGARYKTQGKGPYWVKTAKGATSNVRGQLRVDKTSGGLSVVNEVSLENYVAGTISAEMYASWEPAALQAQAVACRTYALYQMAKRVGAPYDVTADVASQRYLGIRGESESGWAALRATAGQIISYGGRPVLAAFHSASGGETASSKEVWGTSLPYLRSVSVADEDDSPDTYWRFGVSDAHLARGLVQLGHRIGQLEAVEVIERSPSGRASKLRFRGTRGRATVSGREIRQVLGSTTLKSTLFDVRKEAGQVVFVGSGNGHGVGMSQWAAQAMAQQGAGYREILSNFYPGTELVGVEDLKQRFASRATSLARTQMPQGAEPVKSRSLKTKLNGDPAR